MRVYTVLYCTASRKGGWGGGRYVHISLNVPEPCITRLTHGVLPGYNPDLASYTILYHSAIESEK